jgi:Tfp pilus assembly protein PilF
MNHHNFHYIWAFALLFTQVDAQDKRTPTVLKSAVELGGGDLDPKIGLLPEATKALADRAANAFSRRDWPAARKAYEEMLESDPTNGLAWANLGAVEQNAGDLKAASRALEQSVRFNPRVVQSWLALGLVYSASGDRYRAVSCFTRAIHEDPADARAHNYMAIEARRLGWNDTAVAELQRAIEISPEYGLAHFNLATLYLDQKPPAKSLAKRHYEKALSLKVEPDEVLERRLKD